MVRRLREAGAILMGKTNTPEFTLDFDTRNLVYGQTRNPHDPSRSPGGSSGGEGAIIAAGGSPLGLAADLGGSIRVPAHFCGLHGLKPTSGRLTNDDLPPGLMALGNGLAAMVQQAGPIARTVADIQLAMALVAETSLEPTRDLVAPVPRPDPAAVQVNGMRLGMYTDNGFFPASPALAASMVAFRDIIATSGSGRPVHVDRRRGLLQNAAHRQVRDGAAGRGRDRHDAGAHPRGLAARFRDAPGLLRA